MAKKILKCYFTSLAFLLAYVSKTSEKDWKITEQQTKTLTRPFSYKQGLLGQVHRHTRWAETWEDFKAKLLPGEGMVCMLSKEGRCT